MLVPVSAIALLSLVAWDMRLAAIAVGEGITIFRQFSMVVDESNSNISCVPVPMSSANIFIFTY